MCPHAPLKDEEVAMSDGGREKLLDQVTTRNSKPVYRLNTGGGAAKYEKIAVVVLPLPYNHTT